MFMNYSPEGLGGSAIGKFWKLQKGEKDVRSW